ncbi:hypothetical protein KBY66_03395 [Synechococcus sp. Tobar12-5m-g]|uniref:hypothetical protein n=1 Tax=unclassified Synechococcus TaxID=2626047 RepID=UPI0020CE231B|nr:MULTISPECIES: hypothetical protein [unclassified Synechococcus]MCP9771671.1 hypothetical protein [Synechococcus sp. Tobar12-5m-g]MCP9872612.1 hypothetical protein [Synechococcus sp. Cruz CV-v-12]
MDLKQLLAQRTYESTLDHLTAKTIQRRGIGQVAIAQPQQIAAQLQDLRNWQVDALISYCRTAVTATHMQHGDSKVVGDMDAGESTGITHLLSEPRHVARLIVNELSRRAALEGLGNVTPDSVLSANDTKFLSLIGWLERKGSGPTPEWGSPTSNALLASWQAAAGVIVGGFAFRLAGWLAVQKGLPNNELNNPEEIEILSTLADRGVILPRWWIGQLVEEGRKRLKELVDRKPKRR